MIGWFSVVVVKALPLHQQTKASYIQSHTQSHIPQASHSHCIFKVVNPSFSRVLLLQEIKLFLRLFLPKTLAEFCVGVVLTGQPLHLYLKFQFDSDELSIPNNHKYSFREVYNILRKWGGGYNDL